MVMTATATDDGDDGSDLSTVMKTVGPLISLIIRATMILTIRPTMISIGDGDGRDRGRGCGRADDGGGGGGPAPAGEAGGQNEGVREPSE